jgi:FixJ family two-component response regulator
MKAGAVDFLTKPVERDALFEAIERALARDTSKRAAREEAKQLRERFDSLTPRERAVFYLLVVGRSKNRLPPRSASRSALSRRSSRRSSASAPRPSAV